MVDAQIMASPLPGTAFFASASPLIAHWRYADRGTIDRGSDHHRADPALRLPDHARMQWEIKTIGLAIFVYAFSVRVVVPEKRLYNYVAIMIGSMPPSTEKDTAETKNAHLRTGRLCEAAGLHFNRGQRAHSSRSVTSAGSFRRGSCSSRLPRSSP